MYTPRQSLYIRGSGGDPLPAVWKSVEQFRRGQLALICAGPGTGKSALILAYALKSRVPTLYFSADSDSFTQLTRSVSILSGCSLEASSVAVRGMTIAEDIASRLDKTPIRFNYSAAPSLDAIENSVMAYDAMYEDFPHLIVIDNVTNVRTESSDGDDSPFSGLEALMDYLHHMARETSASVVGLHHVTGPHNNGDHPIPLGGIKEQIGRVPELIFTLHRSSYDTGPDTLNVSTVKNRGGRSDPSGQEYTALQFTGETMTIEDYQQ